MLIHTVFFWLDRGISSAKKKSFLRGLKTLKKIKGLDAVFIGRPAATKRPAIDRTYDYGLTVLMKNMKVHEAYQKHALHKRFLEKFFSCWIKVVIYDHQA